MKKHTHQQTFTNKPVDENETFQKGLENYRMQFFSLAVKYFKKGSQQNHLPSKHFLGIMYSRGRGVTKNYQRAISYFEDCIDAEYFRSLSYLAELYLKGQGVEKDIEKAEELYKQAIEFGYQKNSYVGLGRISLEKKNIKEAINYFEKALKIGDNRVYFWLGKLHYLGFGVEKDNFRALEYFEIAKKHDPLSDLYIGKIHFEEGNTTIAIKIFQKLLNKGVREGALELGSIYEKTHDFDKAIEYYEFGMKSDHYLSYSGLGRVYYKKKDFKNSLKYFNLANEYGNPHFFLGNLYLHGEEKNVETAIEYFEKGMEIGIPQCYSSLGELYLKGFHVEKNYKKAYDLFENGMKLNDPDSYYYLGLMYEKGKSVKRDYSVALHIYEEGAKKDSDLCRIGLGVLYYQGLGVKKDIEQAKIYFLSSAHHRDAQIQLGNIHLDEKDYNVAKEYFQKALENGLTNAHYFLSKIYLIEGNITKALEELKKGAELEYPLCYKGLGDLYYFGNYFDKNQDLAFEYHQKGFNKNHPECGLYLSRIYRFGDLKYRDLNKAKEVLEKLYQNDYIKSCSSYSNLLLDLGELDKAKDVLEKGFAEGDLYCQINLARKYIDGVLYKKDLEKGKEILSKLLEQNLISEKTYLKWLNSSEFISFYEDETRKKFLETKNEKSLSKLSLSRIYIYGLGIEKNIEKGIEYLNRGIEQLQVDCINELAIHYYKGKIVPKDEKKSIQLLNQGIQIGDLISMKILIRIYLETNQLEKINESFDFEIIDDLLKGELFMKKGIYDRAYTHFIELYEKKNFESLYHLGNLYLYGKGVEKDLKKSLEFFEKAMVKKPFYLDILLSQNVIDQRNTEIGIVYLKLKEYEKAKEIFEKEAEKGNLYSALEIGKMYFKGLGVEKDIEKANSMFETIIKSENIDLKVKIGEFYFIEKEYQKAKEYLSIGESQKNPISFYYFGIMNLNGIEMEKKLNLAKEYFEKAALLNHKKAKLLMGLMYYYGEGIRKNTKKARELFNQTMDESKRFLIEDYLKTQNYEVARIVLEEESNKEEVKDLSQNFIYGYLGQIYFEGLGVEKNLEIATKYFEKGIEKDDIESMIRLGEILDKGIGVKKDQKRAQELYEKSIEKFQKFQKELRYFTVKNYEKRIQKIIKLIKK